MVGLLAGIVGSLFAGGVVERLRPADDASASAPPTVAASATETIDPASAFGGSDPAGSPAGSPVAAVQQFLEAEARGDFERSFRLLPAALRAEHGTPASWASAHAAFFPIRAFTVRAPTGAAETVVTDVAFRPSLDEVLGLVPARATVTWPVLREGDGWVVDHAGADVEPRYPDAAGARSAARAWATDRQRCRSTKEYRAGLIGRAPLADALCRSEGALRIGSVGPLEPADSGPFVSAFGAPAAGWARTVRVRGPVDLVAVLAPVDDRWLVVGVVEPRDQI